jgi:CHC2-type zinc finger protein
VTGPAPRIDAEALRRALNLLDLLPPGSEVKRIGRDAYMTLCLFHSEARPSMRVTLYRGVWRFRCFPCGANGDALDFVQRTRGLSFRDAIAALATGRTMDLSITTPTRRRLRGWSIVCSSPGCTESRYGDDIASVVLDAVCAGWIVCAAEDAAFDYCPSCADGMRRLR